jgi:ribose transport system permease protein
LTFAIVNGTTFASFANVRNITLDTTTILILAVGATFVLISGGLDLSIGSVLVFSQVIAAKVMIALGGDGWLVLGAGVVVGLISGMAWGLLNGGLVAYGRLNSIIVTLATLGGALGLTQLITSGTDVSEVPPQAAVIGLGRLFGLPYLVVFAFAVTAVFGLLLATTRFGRHTYAIGSNEQAARNAGINVATHYLCVYALSGALSGFAGVLSLFRFSVTSIGGHALDNVAALTAVILGGVSIFGGVGSMFGTFIGAFIPSVLDNGLVISRVSSYWQPVVVAAVLIAAVYLDRIRQDHSDQ